MCTLEWGFWEKAEIEIINNMFHLFNNWPKVGLLTATSTAPFFFLSQQMRIISVSEVPAIAIVYILEGEVHPHPPALPAPPHLHQTYILISIYIEMEVE